MQEAFGRLNLKAGSNAELPREFPRQRTESLCSHFAAAQKRYSQRDYAQIELVDQEVAPTQSVGLLDKLHAVVGRDEGRANLSSVR
jgi:hypothetical protein